MLCARTIVKDKASPQNTTDYTVGEYPPNLMLTVYDAVSELYIYREL